MKSTSRSIVSPDDQRVTFVELFFDLVFVFSVTQVVGLLHDELTWVTVGQAVLAFWLVWWAWTQFTWALNAADTTHHLVDLGTLLATAVAFFMAIGVPNAFHGGAIAFAVPYVVVRTLGLGLYAVVAAANNPTQHAAVRTFAFVSVGGLAAVLLGAFAGGENLYWFWGFAILLDVIAAGVGGQAEGWDLHPEHFAERHGLFVIIALGETLIVAAGSVAGAEWSPRRIGVDVLAVALTCALWWSYFTRTKPAIDHALEAASGQQRTLMARDVFSLTHFPMLCGIIAYAAAIEEAIAHVDVPLPPVYRLALGVGILLFTGGMSVAHWQATRRFLRTRTLIATVGAILVLALASVSPLVTVGLAFVAVSVIDVTEGWNPDV